MMMIERVFTKGIRKNVYSSSVFFYSSSSYLSSIAPCLTHTYKTIAITSTTTKEIVDEEATTSTIRMKIDDDDDNYD